MNGFFVMEHLIDGMRKSAPRESIYGVDARVSLCVDKAVFARVES